MRILGISGGFGRNNQDGAAALLDGASIAAAAEEERFSRIKHAPGALPVQAIRYCLETAHLSRIEEIDVLAFPQTTWGDAQARLSDLFRFHFGGLPKKFEFIDHHYAHACSAFFVSPFQKAAVMTLDWSGDKTTHALWMGEGGKLRLVERNSEILRSLGLFYATITQFLGFRRESDEYKVMGLAAFGRPTVDLEKLFQIAGDGSFALSREYIHPVALEPFPALYSKQLPLFSERLESLLGPHRVSGAPITQHHKDIAASAQAALEKVAKGLLARLRKEGDVEALCLAGGVAMNCKMNGSLARELPSGIFVPPSAGDSGSALGAALAVGVDAGFRYSLPTAALGPSYSSDSVRAVLERSGVSFERVDNPAAAAAIELDRGHIVGWFQGRMEFGPRALGHRSILADPRREEMRDIINARVKFREDFRPFAPSILEETASEYFDLPTRSPFMTVGVPVKDIAKTKIPATTHVDGTARVQTVSRTDEPMYGSLLSEFGKLSGVPCLLNTSFNVSWEPIVNAPPHAIATFFATGLDTLVIEDFVVRKR